jgi:predicted nucleotidyltransferase
MGTKKIGIADALFSKVQQRVLALFFSNPERLYNTNEVIRLTDSGTGAVLRELEKLNSVGLLSMERMGNQKLYRANKKSNLFFELRSMVLKTFGLANVLQDALSHIFPKIYLAFIYGSVAKHEDTAESDIDLMIIADGLSYAELYPLLETVQTKLGRIINPTCYEPAEWAKKRKALNNFIEQVIKHPKIFIKGSDDELASIG